MDEGFSEKFQSYFVQLFLATLDFLLDVIVDEVSDISHKKTNVRKLKGIKLFGKC